MTPLSASSSAPSSSVPAPVRFRPSSRYGSRAPGTGCAGRSDAGGAPRRCCWPSRRARWPSRTRGRALPARNRCPPARARPPRPLVSAPVRIADAATVRLLRPGDRVDVIAAPDSTLGAEGEARVVAMGARVAEVPRPDETRPDGGALVVLTVPRPTAAALAGAGVTSQLAVTVC
ncbi:hypothetical protein O1L60_15715 [Streptomyces diastatochromogenes]|nr:hypothetical protein [Streptomyces diastatochromogenes]